MKIKKIFCSLLAFIAAFSLFAVAACGEPEGGGDPPVLYSVIVAEYDETMGSVALSAPSQEGKYEKDSTVTVTVEPEDGYEVASFAVSGISGAALSGGQYSFKVTADTTVTVSFRSVAAAGCTVTLEYDEELGSVSLSPVAEGNVYAAGSTVIVTVVPNASCAVKSVTVNGEIVEIAGESYGFEIAEDTTIAVVFEPVTYDLHLQYVERYGVVTASAPANGESYAANEEVAVTVAAKEGYVLDSVILNGAADITAAFASGASSIVLSEDSTLTVVFLPVGTPSLDLSVPAAFRGDWKSVDGAHTLTVGKSVVLYDGAVVSAAAVSGEGAETRLSVTAGGATFSASWYGLVEGYVLDCLTLAGETDIHAYYTRDPIAPFKIEDRYYGDWISDNGTEHLSVEENRIVYNDAEASAIVYGGYVESLNGGENSTVIVEASRYFFFLTEGGTVAAHTMLWDRIDATHGRPYVDSYYFRTDDGNFKLELPEGFIGTWKYADGTEEHTLTVTEDLTVMYDGQTVAMASDGDGAFFMENGEKCYISLYPMGDAYWIMIFLSGSTTRYFFREGYPDERATAASLLGTTWRADGYDDIVFGEDGTISLGGEKAVVLAVTERAKTEEVDELYAYTLFVKGGLYTIEIADWDGDPETLEFSFSGGADFISVFYTQA